MWVGRPVEHRKPSEKCEGLLVPRHQPTSIAQPKSMSTAWGRSSLLWQTGVGGREALGGSCGLEEGGLGAPVLSAHAPTRTGLPKGCSQWLPQDQPGPLQHDVGGGDVHMHNRSISAAGGEEASPNIAQDLQHELQRLGCPFWLPRDTQKGTPKHMPREVSTHHPRRLMQGTAASGHK
jgi:hypothetical protein